MSWLDGIWIIGYLVGSVGLTLLARLKSRKNRIEDFFASSGTLGWGLAGLSMVATTFSADTPLAVTGIIRESGISGNWLWWNMIFGGTLTTFLFARLWRRSGVITDLELIRLRYSDRAAGLLRQVKAVWFGLFINGLILAWINVAMFTVLETYFGLDRWSAWLILATLVGLTMVSVCLGGLRAVVYLDAFQFGLAMIGAIVLAVFAVESPLVNGLEGLRNKLADSGALDFFPTLGSGTSTKRLEVSWSHIAVFLGLQWWASWYPGSEPGGGGYIAQRMFATRNEGSAMKSVLLFLFLHYAVRPWPWILVGLSCLILYPNLQVGGQGYILAMRDVLPAGLGGLMLVGFGAAFMSTLSTHLNWGASYLVNDWLAIKKPHLKTERQGVVLSQLVVVGLGLIGLAGSLVVERVEKVWLFLIECGAGTGGILILRWLWWRVTAAAELVGTILPFVLFGLQKLLNLYWESGSETGFFTFPNTYFIAVLGTTLGWLLVVWLGPQPDPKATSEFDEQVRPFGWWPEQHFGRNRLVGILLLAWLTSAFSILGFLLGTGYLLIGSAKIGLQIMLVSISGIIILTVLHQKYNIFKDRLL